MHAVTKAFAFLLAVALASCATLDKNECANADWYAIGLEDGARGGAIERLGQHRRACAEHGVAPQPERYLAGREQGLKSFCTYQRGYANGRAGQAFVDVCPAPLAQAFAAGYRERLETLSREAEALERELGARMAN